MLVGGKQAILSKGGEDDPMEVGSVNMENVDSSDEGWTERRYKGKTDRQRRRRFTPIPKIPVDPRDKGRSLEKQSEGKDHKQT